MHLPFLMADWSAPSHVQAMTTLRYHPYTDELFNLSPFTGEQRTAANNRIILEQQLEPSYPIHWLSQVHGTTLVELPFASVSPQADGCWTQKPGQFCTILTADCLPVVLTDRQGSIVCALHAGWRGLAGGIVQNALRLLKTKTTQPIIAWLGPAIGPQSFQVGPEVREAFIAVDQNLSEMFVPDVEDKWLGDLYAIARFILKTHGVEHISGGQYCTMLDKEKFFSHRREQKRGRMATLVRLLPTAA